MKFIITDFSALHNAQLRHIYLTGRHHAFPWMNPDSYKLDDFDRDTEGEKILVAVVDETPIGFISCWEPDNFIHCLYVLPDFQRFGIGKALLEACLDRITRPARLKCVLANVPATNFYQKQGWTIGETGESFEGDYALMLYNQNGPGSLTIPQKSETA